MEEKSAKSQLQQLILNQGLKWREGLVKNKAPKWIFDLREVILTPKGLHLATLLLAQKLEGEEFDLIGGPSIAAEPLVASLVLHFYNQKNPKQGFIVRKEPNNFGLRKKVEGPIWRGARVILLDDAINSGTNMKDAVIALQTEGCHVVKILTLVDFHASGNHIFKENGYAPDSIYTLKDFGLQDNLTYAHTTRKKKYVFWKDYKRDESIITELTQLLKEECNVKKWYTQVNNNLITVTTHGKVCCFSPSPYSLIWSHEIGEMFPFDPILEENFGLFFTNSGSHRSSLHYFSLPDGKLQGKVLMKGSLSSPPANAPDMHVLGTTAGFVYALDRKKKSVLWKAKTGGSNEVTPCVHDDTIYLPSQDGFVYALTSEGKTKWKKHLGSSYSLPPLVESDVVIVTSDANVMFCLNKENGAIHWIHELKNDVKDFKVFSHNVVLACDQGYVTFLDLAKGILKKSFKISNLNVLKIKKFENNELVIILEDGRHYSVSTSK